MSGTTKKTAFLLFGLGLAALIYQTAWERMLRLVFGASTSASSAVLAIFLGGLGLGGAWLGRRAERSRNPLVLYGNLEAGVAVTAALTPFSVELVQRIYYALGGTTSLGQGGATICRLLLTALVLGPSVVLMGGTLPAAARAIESDADLARGRAATLYAANTAGAVIGALLGTFLLFELFGTRLSLWTAALINLLVAMLARRAGAKLEVLPPSDEAEASATPSPVAPWLVYVAAAAVGFVFLAQEIIWYRVLGPILGGSSFSFGLILAVALAGIGIGGFAYARRRESNPATIGLLALTVALEAAFFAVPIAMGDGVALLAAYTRAMAGLGFAALCGTWAAITALVVLPGAIVSGFQFPVLFALLGQGRTGVARQIGLSYAFNTLGSIAGALLAGFVLVPRIGAIGAWKLSVILLIALVVLLLIFDRRGRAGIGFRSAAGISAILALWFSSARGPSAVSRHTPIGAGRVPIANADRNGVREWMNQTELSILWEKDGVESAVGVNGDNGVAFIVNGKSDGNAVNDRGTQVLLGLIPALIHPHPKRAFVLGLGTGMSAGWLASVPGMTKVDVAELETAVLGVARECRSANQNVLEQGNVEVRIGDGRELLVTQNRRYDLIVSEPSNPYRAGIASLFTREFYQLVGAHLEADGLFGQWVQGYEIDAQTLRIVLATLKSAFPVVDIWHTQGGDFLMVAGFVPRAIDVDELRRRVATEPYATILPRGALVADAEGVLSRYIAEPGISSAIGGALDAPINTDDSMVLEYAFARHVGVAHGSMTSDLLSLTFPRDLDRPPVRGEVDWGRVNEQRGRAWLIVGDHGDPLPIKDPHARARAAAVDAGCTGDSSAALAAWSNQPLEPRDPIERYVLGMAYAEARDERALDLAGQLGAAGFLAEEHLVRARYLTRQGKPDAFEELERALAELRKTALPLCDVARQTIRGLQMIGRGNPDLAARAAHALLEAPLAVHIEDQLRIRAAQQLAFASGSTELCVAALGKNLELPWWNEVFLASRADCLERAGHPMATRARRELGEWIDNSLGRIGAGLELPAAPAVSAAPADDGGP